MVWRGIFAIPVTPFHPDRTLDYDSLRRQTEFCLQAGANGIVYPGVVSEFFVLTDSERAKATETVLATAVDHVPVIVGISAPSAPQAVGHASHAAAHGAAGLMAMAPYVHHLFAPSPVAIADFYRTINAAVDLPIVLQNARMGVPIPIDQLADVLDSAPGIRYVKEEVAPSTHRLSRVIEVVGNRLDGVFAGIGGIYLINELQRGAAGTMPAPPLVDFLVAAYRLYESGDLEAASDLLLPLAPIFTLELLYNLAVIKELLVRRGLIRHAVTRTPFPALDAVDRADLDRAARRLQWD